MQELTEPPVETSQYLEAPAESDPLAKKWHKRIASANKHWEKYHKRVKHNRELVAGFNWKNDPNSDDFYSLRANLIHGTITAILPNIYARNPEISVTAQHQGRDLKLLCRTIETVTNRQMTDAKLKQRAKSTVKAALTCSMGILKVMYQRDMASDPIIHSRIDDTQDNISRVEGLMMALDDPNSDTETLRPELEQTVNALSEKTEVVAAEGLVMDRVMSDMLLIDPTVLEFWDYETSDWMIEKIPMKKSAAEARFKYKLDKAKAYSPTDSRENASGRLMSGSDAKLDDDTQVMIYEIWDKQSSRVLTLCDGCDYFLREPYSPDGVGERWYPYFILPFQPVDGQFIGPSLVDLTEKLQKEHNDARQKFNDHRDLIKPGWITGGDTKQKDIETYTNTSMGEITVFKDLTTDRVANAIMPKNHPPIDPQVYDTSAVRYDWEQVSGMQDAARSSVVQPKTATEASIMQQSLSGRVSEFRDQVEDFICQIAQYAAQILLQELSPMQVERIMGPHKQGPMMQQIPDPMTGAMMEMPAVDPATGQPVMVDIEKSYDWPQMSRDEVFDLVQLQIRAGTTGEPDKMEAQEIWIKLMPVIQPLITQIMQMQMQGIDTAALEALLKETVARFDDKLDIDTLMPKLKPLPPPPMPGQLPPQ